MNIDIHHHFIPDAYLEAVRSDPEAMGARLTGEMLDLDFGFKEKCDKPKRDLKRHVQEMDEVRLDMAALSPMPPLLGYRYPLEIGQRVCSVLNDAIADAVRTYPDRFVAMGHVPLQDVDAAIAELEKRAFPSVQIGSNVNGRNLDAPELLPFFKACESLGTLVFVHPNSSDIIGLDRLSRYYLRNFIGNVTETAVVAASLMFGGVLDACPNLKVVLAHAGGSTPYIWGRWEHGQSVRAEGKVRTSTPISVLKKKLYFDTITHSPSALRFLVEEVGPGKVVIGTDYPADMGCVDQVARIERLGFGDDATAQLLGGNAASLLGL